MTKKENQYIPKGLNFPAPQSSPEPAFNQTGQENLPETTPQPASTSPETPATTLQPESIQTPAPTLKSSDKSQYQVKSIGRPKKTETQSESQPDFMDEDQLEEMLQQMRNGSNPQQAETKPKKEKKHWLTELKPSANNQNIHEHDEFLEPERRLKSWVKWTIGIVACLGLVVGIFFAGWMNTDMDENGNAYLVGLDIRQERDYIAQADDLLGVILTYDEGLENLLLNMNDSYVENAAALTEWIAVYQGSVNTLSRYTDVPSAYQPYHQQIINFTLNLITFLQNAQSSINQSTYSTFVSSGLEDYRSSLSNLKESRLEIEQDLYRNMTNQQALNQGARVDLGE